MASELESASPRRSEGNPVVKSLKEESSAPSVMGVLLFSGVAESWFRRTERIACVPQAFWIVWFAKKKDSGRVSGEAGVPSWVEDVVEVEAWGRRYLKRKITP
jgi:hypothetical protein